MVLSTHPSNRYCFSFSTFTAWFVLYGATLCVLFPSSLQAQKSTSTKSGTSVYAGVAFNTFLNYSIYDEVDELGIAITYRDNSNMFNATIGGSTFIYTHTFADDAGCISSYTLNAEIALEGHLTKWLWLEPSLLGRINYFKPYGYFGEEERPLSYILHAQYGGAMSLSVKPTDAFWFRVGYTLLNRDYYSISGGPPFQILACRLSTRLF